MFSIVAPLAATVLAATVARAQVTATFPNGATNPAQPTYAAVGSYVNQTSLSRLLSLDGVDDWCAFGPPEAGPDSLIGNVEPIVVAYCTKPRNGARLIPDGTVKSAHYIKTPLYVQISGLWDGTKINIVSGDSGGELDPHGAENLGNPIGGNVTSHAVTGSDVFYEEWMSFISYDQYCLRICTAQTATVSTALQCEHELDIMGCSFVMAINNLSEQSFTECDGEAAAPPGLYPVAGGGTSTFRQRYTGTFTNAGTTGFFTVGQTVTPSAPAFYPSTSNCHTYSTISNGVNTNNYQVTAVPTTLKGGSAAAVSGVGSTSVAPPSTTRPASSSSSSASSTSRSGSASASGSTTSGSASGSASASRAATSSSGAAAHRAEIGFPAPVALAVMAGAMLFGGVAVFL